MHIVYILLCRDGSYYTGYTNNIEKRLIAHRSGKWAKYTRWRLPVELIYSEIFEAESEARKREYAIKQLSKKQKEILIKNPSV